MQPESLACQADHFASIAVQLASLPTSVPNFYYLSNLSAIEPLNWLIRRGIVAAQVDKNILWFKWL